VVICLKCDVSAINYDSPIHPSFRAFKDLHDIDSTLTSDIQPSSNELPEKYCDNCKTVTTIRPDIVWFGESLSKTVLGETEDIIHQCDLCFVIGTSSQVYPAAGFSGMVLRRSVTVIEINPHPELGETDDNLIIVPEKSGEFLPKVVELMNNNE